MNMNDTVRPVMVEGEKREALSNNPENETPIPYPRVTATILEQIWKK